MGELARAQLTEMDSAPCSHEVVVTAVRVETTYVNHTSEPIAGQRLDGGE
jgi:hypothetical protein